MVIRQQKLMGGGHTSVHENELPPLIFRGVSLLIKAYEEYQSVYADLVFCMGLSVVRRPDRYAVYLFI